jgi:hypothetical protein
MEGPPVERYMGFNEIINPFSPEDKPWVEKHAWKTRVQLFQTPKRVY